MNDQDTTEQLPPAQPPPEPPPEEPRRLTRSRDDRVIAGVAAGLAAYFKVDPVIVRIAFAVSIFFGGLGLIAYIALALFVPTATGPDGEPEAAPVERSRLLAVGVGIGLVVIALSWGIFDGPLWGNGFFFSPALFLIALAGGAILIARQVGGGGVRRSALATVLIAFAAFVVLSIVAVAAGWAAATGHGVAVAIAVIAIGGMLVVAAFNGGARWLIAPALALAVPLGAVTAADISFGEGIGDRHYRPLEVASVPDRYELGIGRLAVDLRALDWTDSTVVDLELDLGVGEAIVAVPEDVCVTTDFSAKAGDLLVASERADGVDVESAVNTGATATPRLDLTGEVDLGELRVINLDDADITDDHWRGFNDRFADDRDEMAAALERACAPDPPASPDPPGSAEPGAGDEERGG